MFDVIVVGLGAMGSSAAYHLSQRGKRVLGLEAFTPAHNRGSSHGGSRIIRQAYFEHPAYVPLVLRAYQLWECLQSDTGDGLMQLTGGLSIGLPNSQVVAGAIASAQQYQLEHEVLDNVEIRRRFTQFAPQSHEIALYETKAGYLRPEECIRRQLTASSNRGAELHFEEPMVSWTANNSGEGVDVRTAREAYQASHLILTTGPWAPQVLADLDLPIQAYRRVMFWLDPGPALNQFHPGRCPVYIWQPEGSPVFYGFPSTDGSNEGAKVAIHTGNEPCTPDSIDRTIRPDDEAAIRALIANRIPALNGPVVKAQTCMYTMTPDENFIVERHRKYPQVCIAAGFSGHGFKFSSVIGEILADIATKGETSHDIGLFSSRRFESSAAKRPS